MKKNIITLVLLLSSFAYSQNNTKEIRKIKKVLHQSAIDWSNGNIEKYMDAYWKSDQL